MLKKWLVKLVIYQSWHNWHVTLDIFLITCIFSSLAPSGYIPGGPLDLEWGPPGHCTPNFSGIIAPCPLPY